MSLAPILCSHCGRDYAREYWVDTVTGDPNVCRSCRRDTNLDAADAPRWVAGAHADEDETLPPATVVTPARKQCRVCRGEWDGLIFGPPAAKGSPLPFGICPACAAKDDARYAPVVSFGMPLPELERPRRVVEVE